MSQSPVWQWRLSWRWLLAFVGLFLIEGLIALFAGGLLRTFVGDVLVIPLLFCLVCSCLKGPPHSITIAILVFAWAVEIAQAFELIVWLGLADNTLARIVLGATFDWHDLLAYLLGAVLSLWLGAFSQSYKAPNTLSTP